MYTYSAYHVHIRMQVCTQCTRHTHVRTRTVHTQCMESVHNMLYTHAMCTYRAFLMALLASQVKRSGTTVIGRIHNCSVLQENINDLFVTFMHMCVWCVARGNTCNMKPSQMSPLGKHRHANYISLGYQTHTCTCHVYVCMYTNVSIAARN